MARIQDADLHHLVSMDIGGEGRADAVPIGTACAKRILDHPLAEILVRHGGGIGDADLAGQRQFGGAGGGHDAIDHGIGKGAVGVDPIGEVGVGEPRKSRHHLPQDRAIAPQVVARKARERPLPRRPPEPQRRDHRAKSGAGAARMGHVMGDVGMGCIEAPGGIDEIAALGHGQGHDADRGIGHGGDEGGVALCDGEIVDHRPGHFGAAALGRQFDERGHAILRQEPVAHARVIGADACAKDGPILRQTLLHQAVGIPGLMGAVKIAQPDMDDAGREPRAVIAGAQDVLRQIGQRGGGERNGAVHGHQLIHWPPSTL